ncbi:type VII toxin-antitoxin system MntA family adenylyltransferase antitoxin [Halonatronum saccharophilum]|uniref:type VII toxin-antitoxin system MntA family adenylyltransferase antitoxin n=1 Tax=Halonatronum saccharophilum TaxID=150060 RepID=UPI0004849707|nr:nucleotidyltransferase domain-containing protein [Halonatronum saccharophilum]
MDIIEIIKEVLLKEIDPILIYIFGSFAQDKLREDSDIDIGFLSDEEVDPYKVFLIAQSLADKVKREVDLIDISNASTVFKVQIIQGKNIYAKDKLSRENFEMLTLKEYARLNEERSEVLEGIKRGVMENDG